MKKQNKTGKKLKLSKDTLRLLQDPQILDRIHGAGLTQFGCGETNHPTVCPGPICTGQ